MFLGFLCALAIFLCSISLIWSSHYNDGIIGRISLVLLAIGNGVGIVLRDSIAWYEGSADFQHSTLAGLFVLGGMAMFLGRKVYLTCMYTAAGKGRRETESHFHPQRRAQ